MFTLINELYEVLLRAQDNNTEKWNDRNKIDLMRGSALVDGPVLRHLVIFHQAEAPVD